MQTASDPWREGEPPHVPWQHSHGPLPPVCLIPGDPDRVDLYAEVLDEFRILGRRREYVLAVGTFEGQPIAVCSTGIGGPSTEIAIVELARLGVTTVIRTGGMGAITRDVPSGDIVVVGGADTSASGTARAYEADPRVGASPSVVEALHGALAAGEGRPGSTVDVISADSYYVAEGRPLPGLEGHAERRYRELFASGAAGVDMEAATAFAVAKALGLQYGAILVAHGNRVDDTWVADYTPRQLVMMRAAAGAAAGLGASAR